MCCGHSGELHTSELVEALARMRPHGGAALTAGERARLTQVARVMMTTVDSDGNGSLNLGEFKVLCSKVSEDQLSTGLDAVLAAWSREAGCSTEVLSAAAYLTD